MVLARIDLASVRSFGLLSTIGCALLFLVSCWLFQYIARQVKARLSLALGISSDSTNDVCLTTPPKGLAALLVCSALKGLRRFANRKYKEESELPRSEVLDTTANTLHESVDTSVFSPTHLPFITARSKGSTSATASSLFSDPPKPLAAHSANTFHHETLSPTSPEDHVEAATNIVEAASLDDNTSPSVPLRKGRKHKRGRGGKG